MNREDVAKRNASIVRDMRNGMRIRDVMKSMMYLATHATAPCKA